MMKPAPVTIALIVICVVLYIPELLNISIAGADIDYWLCVDPTSLSRPWELVTAIFAHGSLEHLAMNMISLYWLGTMIEDIHGKVRFLILFFVSGIMGNLAVVLFSNSAALGASGAIFGLLGAAALLLFTMRSNPRARSMLSGLLVMLVINVANSFLPGISMEAHFGGLIGGVAVEGIFIAIDKARAKRPRSLRR